MFGSGNRIHRFKKMSLPGKVRSARLLGAFLNFLNLGLLGVTMRYLAILTPGNTAINVFIGSSI